MMKLSLKIASSFALVACCLAFAGCGKSDGLVAVSGKVTIDGAPATAGSVNFMPIGETGTPAGCQIGEGGVYQARVTPGKLSVTIHVQQEVEREDATEDEKARGLTKTIADVKFLQEPGDDVLSIDAQAGQTYDFPLTTK